MSKDRVDHNQNSRSDRLKLRPASAPNRQHLGWSYCNLRELFIFRAFGDDEDQNRPPNPPPSSM